jgi:hypothetical protein
MEEDVKIQEFIDKNIGIITDLKYVCEDGKNVMRMSHSDGSYTDYPIENLIGYDTIDASSVKVTADAVTADANAFRGNECNAGVAKATTAATALHIADATSYNADSYISAITADNHSVLNVQDCNGISINGTLSGGFVTGGYVYPTPSSAVAGQTTSTYDWCAYFEKPFWATSKENKESLMKQMARTYVELLMSGTSKDILWLAIDKDKKLLVFKQEADARKVSLDDMFKKAASFAAKISCIELLGPIVGDLTIDWYIGKMESLGRFIEAFYDMERLMKTRRLDAKKFKIKVGSVQEKKTGESLWGADKPYWTCEDEDEEIYADEELEVIDGNDCALVSKGNTVTTVHPGNVSPSTPLHSDPIWWNHLVDRSVYVGDSPWQAWQDTITCTSANQASKQANIANDIALSSAKLDCKTSIY